MPNGATVASNLSTGAATLQFLACQGATTANITDTSQVIRRPSRRRDWPSGVDS